MGAGRWGELGSGPFGNSQRCERGGTELVKDSYGGFGTANLTAQSKAKVVDALLENDLKTVLKQGLAKRDRENAKKSSSSSSTGLDHRTGGLLLAVSTLAFALGWFAKGR